MINILHHNQIKELFLEIALFKYHKFNNIYIKIFDKEFNVIFSPVPLSDPNMRLVICTYSNEIIYMQDTLMEYLNYNEIYILVKLQQYMMNLL